MKVIKTPQDMMQWRDSLQGKTIGFVPTMGALHEGHASLLKNAKKNSDLVVLSIFVNPTQFNDPNDFSKYPKTWEADLAMAEREGVDVVFYPEYSQMYPDNYKYQVIEKEFSKELCGAHRAGHFDGVLSVVMKLLQIVNPHFAFFGEKDFQQLQLIKGMAQAFFLRTEIVNCPTLREADGLALSSRNVRLTSENRPKAPLIYKTIKDSTTAVQAKQQLSDLGFDVEYVEDKFARRFVAVKMGEVRLIDNVQI